VWDAARPCTPWRVVARTGTLYAAVAESPVEVATTDTVGPAADHVQAELGTVRAPGSVDELQRLLRDRAYLADRGLATSILLALSLNQPLLLEGEAGVGKTEVAKALSSVFGAELVRLQCYEGIDANQALYEWDFTRQLLYARAIQESGDEKAEQIFSPRFLQERPLLKALRLGDRAVLLIDEIDRADDEFEAFLLEVLSDFQVTVPELGTIHAERPPLVILTSNRTRELHDALKRRCLYHWIDYPDLPHEVEIVKTRAPDVPDVLAAKVAHAVGHLRNMDLVKKPGVSESITWARALQVLGLDDLDADAAEATLGSVLKDHEDLVEVRENLQRVLGG
jgi:MoxR-like ATPase